MHFRADEGWFPACPEAIEASNEIHFALMNGGARFISMADRRPGYYKAMGRNESSYEIGYLSDESQ